MCVSYTVQGIKTILCFFLGERYNSMLKDREAYLLYNRAVEYCDALEEESGGKSASALFASVLETARNVAGKAHVCYSRDTLSLSSYSL